jgi:hypothetical protein
MGFGLEKCASVYLRSGKVHREHIGNTMKNKIKDLEPMKACKYMGTGKSHNVEHKNEKENLKEYATIIILVLNIQLSTKNKIQAIGSFEIIKWHEEEIQKPDRKIRKMLSIHRQHHPRADTDHLDVPRKGGGRGVMKTEGAHIAEVMN